MESFQKKDINIFYTLGVGADGKFQNITSWSLTVTSPKDLFEPGLDLQWGEIPYILTISTYSNPRDLLIGEDFELM